QRLCSCTISCEGSSCGAIASGTAIIRNIGKYLRRKRHTISLRVNRDDNTVLDRDGVRSDRGDGVGSPERHIADKINDPIATRSIQLHERISGHAATANPQRAIAAKRPNLDDVGKNAGVVERKNSITVDLPEEPFADSITSAI